MQLDTFSWVSPIPRSLYLDKPALYNIVLNGWEVRLQAAHGYRIQGPIHLQAFGFGYIDDNSMEEVLVKTELSPLWTYAIVRVSGPAMRP